MTIKQEQEQIKRMIDKLDCSSCLKLLKEKIKDIRIRHNSERIERGVGRTQMYRIVKGKEVSDEIKNATEGSLRHHQEFDGSAIPSEATIVAMTCWECHSDKMELKTKAGRMSIFQCPMCGAYASLTHLGKLTVV